MAKSNKKQTAASAPPSWAQLDDHSKALIKRIGGDQFTQTLLTGAFQVAQSTNPIRGNLFAGVMRELITVILHELAPTAEVTACAWYRQDPNANGPTRGQRVRFIAMGGLGDNYVRGKLKIDPADVARPLIQAVDALHNRTHVRPLTVLFDDIEVRRLAHDALEAAASVLDAAEESRELIGDRLAGQLNGVVLEHMISEVIPDLDELSTHTQYDQHQIDGIRITKLGPKTATYLVEGTVFVSLQYGSNSDVRNDRGAVMSDDYPFEATISAAIGRPEQLLRDTLKVKVDTSSFYE
ncbi:hypothetical protein ACO2Q0_01540 [Phenylobacterium sp. VNQ135]|uniref:pPIWI-associating nuclease domain-containing protein n=1 Tax=Phenylobacterium sp. VNQ135 TaxID=3400922 RepID=UPI003C03F3D9